MDLTTVPVPTDLATWDEFERILVAAPRPLQIQAHRHFGPRSRYYLLRFVLTTRDIRDAVTGERQVCHPFVWDYCNAMEEESNNVVDIGARGHWKSTIKSFAGPIQFILGDPNRAVCIFSIQRKLAKAHLSRVQQEFEGNPLLYEVWPEIFFQNPRSSIHGAPMWSLESGLILKRNSNRTEGTIEAHAFESSLPTGKHYDLLIFDDIVDEDSCRTAAGREKLEGQWELALNLSNRGAQYWYVGTYYHANDLWVWLEEEKGYRVRKRPAVDVEKPAPEGKVFLDKANRYIDYSIIGGEPVFLTPKELADKAWDYGPKVYGQQMLTDPRAGEAGTLDEKKLHYYSRQPGIEANAKTRYLLIDPANQTKKDSDSTGMMVVGLGADQNVYILDLVKGKLDPEERIRTAMMLHRQWTPLETRWEQTGLEADTFWLQQFQEREGYRFPVQALAWRINKQTRIADNIGPLIEQRRLWLPREIQKKVDGEFRNVVIDFVTEEIAKFPLSREDHWLDCLGLLFHPKAPPLVWPAAGPRRIIRAYGDNEYGEDGSWMTA